MKREEFEAIIKAIDEGRFTSIVDVTDMCEPFINANPKLIEEGLDVDKHRWYEISTSVYQIGEWYLGISGVTDVFSERMGFDDCGVETTACEMEAVPSVTYIPKGESK